MGLTGNILPIYATTPKNVGIELAGSSLGTLGSDTNSTVIYTAGSNGSRVYGLILSTTDGTAANNIFLFIKTSGGAVYPIGQVNIPVNSGNTASTPCVDALNSSNCPGLPTDSNGKPYIELAAGSYLKMSLVNAVTATKAIYSTTIGANY